VTCLFSFIRFSKISFFFLIWWKFYYFNISDLNSKATKVKANFFIFSKKFFSKNFELLIFNLFKCVFRLHTQVAITNMPLWHRYFFSSFMELKKVEIYFLQKLANGGHREYYIMTPRFFSSCLTLRKKSNLIFAKFREKWLSRILYHDAALFFILLDA